jgi:hypothetical protein
MEIKVSWTEHKDEWLNLITESVTFLKKTKAKSLHQNNAKRALNRLLRAWTDYPPAYVSEKALLLFQAKGINPFSATRKDSRIFNSKGDNKKSLIVFEHTTPIDELNKLLVSVETSKIEEVLLNYSGVCWITREEDDRLNQNNFRKHRNGNWAKAYSSLGINTFKL